MAEANLEWTSHLIARKDVLVSYTSVSSQAVQLWRHPVLSIGTPGIGLPYLITHWKRQPAQETVEYRCISNRGFITGHKGHIEPVAVLRLCCAYKAWFSDLRPVHGPKLATFVKDMQLLQNLYFITCRFSLENQQPFCFGSNTDKAYLMWTYSELCMTVEYTYLNLMEFHMNIIFSCQLTLQATEETLSNSGLMEKRCNSNANISELCLFCIKPLVSCDQLLFIICYYTIQ